MYILVFSVLGMLCFTAIIWSAIDVFSRKNQVFVLPIALLMTLLNIWLSYAAPFANEVTDLWFRIYLIPLIEMIHGTAAFLSIVILARTCFLIYKGKPPQSQLILILSLQPKQFSKNLNPRRKQCITFSV